METDPKSVGTPPPLWKIPDYFFFFFEPFPYELLRMLRKCNVQPHLHRLMIMVSVCVYHPCLVWLLCLHDLGVWTPLLSSSWSHSSLKTQEMISSLKITTIYSPDNFCKHHILKNELIQDWCKTTTLSFTLLTELDLIGLRIVPSLVSMSLITVCELLISWAEIRDGGGRSRRHRRQPKHYKRTWLKN